jgi:hypothetical protein
MKHIKTYRLFENLNIDTEEIELLFVNLTDDDFQVHASKIYDGFKVEIERVEPFNGIEIKDELLFAIDLTKRKYNLVLSKIYCKSSYTKGSKQLVDNIEKVFSEVDNLSSSFTRLKYIELYFTKEKVVVEEPKKGFIGNFLDRFKDKEIPVEEKIIDDDVNSCKRYINSLEDGTYKFFVSNKETLDEIVRVYGTTRLVQKDLKEDDGGFIVTLKKLPEPSNSRSNLRW